jgi:hypothetical protein
MNLALRGIEGQIRPSADRNISSIHKTRTLAGLRDAAAKLSSGDLRVKTADRMAARSTA